MESKTSTYIEKYPSLPIIFFIKAVIILMGVAICYVGFYQPTIAKEEKINQIKSKTIQDEGRVIALVDTYNAMDGYKHIKINEKGGIEYIGVMEKPSSLPNIQFPDVPVEYPLKENSVYPESSTVNHVDLGSSFNSEITPLLYKEIDLLVKTSKDERFKEALKVALEDGKITYGEYQSLSKPMALINKETQKTSPKDSLLNEVQP